MLGNNHFALVLASPSLAAEINPYGTNYSGYFVMPLSTPRVDTHSIGPSVAYPSHFFVPFESGLVAYTNAAGTEINLVEQTISMARRPIAATCKPVSFWPDGTVKHAHIHANITFTNDGSTSYFLEWHDPIPYLYSSSGFNETGCMATDCSATPQCVMVCDFTTQIWMTASLCDEDCCVCALSNFDRLRIGTPCTFGVDSNYVVGCTGIVGYLTDDRYVSGVSVYASPEYGAYRPYVVTNGDKTTVLLDWAPLINSGDFYMLDSNDIKYSPANVESRIETLDNNMIVYHISGELCSYSGVGNSIETKAARFSTYISNFALSDVWKFNHQTILLDKDILIKEHCFLFQGFTGQVLTRNMNNLSPYEVSTDGIDTKISLWPSGRTDTNSDADYAAGNVHKFAYLAKGSGANAVLNLNMPTGYVATLSGFGDTSSVDADFIGLAMGIEFGLNIGRTSQLLQYTYETNPVGYRNLDYAGNINTIGPYGAYTGEYNIVDTYINNGIIGYLEKSSIRNAVSGWHVYGQQYTSEHILSNRINFTGGVADNNNHNVLALGWKQYFTTADTGVLTSVRAGTNHLINMVQLKVDATFDRKAGAFADNSAIIGGSQDNYSLRDNTANINTLLHSWLVDCNYFARDGFGIWANSLVSGMFDRGARECTEISGRCGDFISYIMVNPDTLTYELVDMSPPCCVADVPSVLSGYIGSGYTLGDTPQVFYMTGVYNPDDRIDITDYFNNGFTKEYHNLPYQFGESLDLVSANSFVWVDTVTNETHSIMSGFMTNNPSGLVNDRHPSYRANQLWAQEWLPKVSEQFTGYNDYLISSANNMMSGTFSGAVPLAVMARAYDLTGDTAYLTRFAGWVHQQQYIVYSGSNPTWQFYSPNFADRAVNSLAAWPRYKGALQRAGIGITDIPLETGSYPNGDTTGTLTTEITNYGAKVYVYNTGGSPIVGTALNTGRLGKVTTDSRLYVRTQSGTVTSGLNLNFLTHSNPANLLTNLRQSAWEYFVEPTSGSIPTGVSQLVLGGNVSIYRPVTQYPEASIIPKHDNVLNRRRLQISVCSGVLYPYSGPMSGTFTCTHHQSGYNTAPAFISVGGTGTWLLPEESVSYVWSGPTELVINCQDSSNILARFSGQEAIAGTNNIGLFGDLSYISTLLPLVTGLSY